MSMYTRNQFRKAAGQLKTAVLLADEELVRIRSLLLAGREESADKRTSMGIANLKRVLCKALDVLEEAEHG